MKKLIYICCLVGFSACNAGTDKKIETNTSTPNSLQTPVADGALNPAHGAPGHRCDIAVGAPLNSPAAQPDMQQTPSQMPTTAPSAPVANDKGLKLNPEHGQPGHDCKLPVGAPLT